MLWIMYGMQANNRVLELIVFCPNFIFYCMEMKFVITKKLIMIVAGGELGPVETEIILSALIISFGYFGPEFY